MLRWGMHLVAICGGIAAILAAGTVRDGILDPRTLTFEWSGYFGSHALVALAGFLLVLPLVWPAGSVPRPVRVRWGVLAVYLLVGDGLVALLPVSTFMVMRDIWATAGQVVLVSLPEHNMSLLSYFGAMLSGAGMAHALGQGPHGE
ncbi:MAG: hypothetical protein AB2385_15335 [Symbiobacterium sp.]|uniref:hypothetical protein n=1 Tax=Symbiobacterium sp. TaxID=1971213 RepID=UPI0034642797